MYRYISRFFQGLNPDPEDMSDEDEEDAIYEDAEDQEIDFGGAGDAGMF